MKDFEIVDHGTIWTFKARSERAAKWVHDHVQIEDWQWFGPYFCVDHRPAHALYEGILAEGFTVETRR